MRILHLFLILLFLPAQVLSKQPLLPYPEPPRQAATTAAVEGGPVLQNPGFECGDGYHDEPGIRGMVPNGWTATILSGEKPFTVSTQLWAKSGTG